MPAFGWLARCAISAAIFLLVCGLATVRFANGLQLPTTTTRDGTLVTLNRYVEEPVPDVVLVGSSLTFRLSEPYFSIPKLRNLALAGGSAVTGLEIVAAGRRLPKLILIEANILSRLTDTDLVQKYRSRNTAETFFSRPIRVLVAAYENWHHAPLSNAQISAALDRLVEGPPANFDNHRYVERALQQWNAEDPSSVTRRNIERVKLLIQSIEHQGTRVLLFELPYFDELETARFAQLAHEVVHGSFAEPDRWLNMDYKREELRWPDGIHLDERSAVMVARSMDKAVLSLLSR
jgi:hypothetical protein